MLPSLSCAVAQKNRLGPPILAHALSPTPRYAINIEIIENLEKRDIEFSQQNSLDTPLGQTPLDVIRINLDGEMLC